MKIFFTFAVLLLMEITSILTQSPTCLKFDFNDPLILSQFERCSTSPTSSTRNPFVIKSYNQSSIIPFRSSSRYFLSTNVDRLSCLMSLSKMILNPTTIFKIACFQVNAEEDDSFSVAFPITETLHWGLNFRPAANEWIVYEGIIVAHPNYPIEPVSIRAFLRVGADVAFEYLDVYDPEITDENCVPHSPTIPPQICQWEPGQEILSGNLCRVPDGFFVFQLDGNAVIYDVNDVPIWNTQTDGIGHTFLFRTDGNLVMYSSAGTVVWNSGSQNQGGSLLVFQQDRNLVIYNTTNTPIALWNTRTNIN